MRTIKLLALILFVGGNAFAADRLGNARNEVARSSFTDTTPNVNVVIASAPENGNGIVIVRSVTFSGVKPSTVTFYDANLFTVNTTTIARVEYVPITSPGTNPGTTFTQVFLDLYCSSGAMYNKQGIAPVLIKWDYSTPPRSGDARK